MEYLIAGLVFLAIFFGTIMLAAGAVGLVEGIKTGYKTYQEKIETKNIISKTKKECANSFYDSPLAYLWSTSGVHWRNIDDWAKEDFIDFIGTKIPNKHIFQETLRGSCDINLLKQAIKELPNIDFTDLFETTQIFTEPRVGFINNSAEIYGWSMDDMTENDYSLLFEEYVNSVHRNIAETIQKYQERIKVEELRLQEQAEKDRAQDLKRQVQEEEKSQLHGKISRAKMRALHKMSALEELRTDGDTDVSNFVNINMRKV